MENFRNLRIDENILKVIKEERFENPTEIQNKTIPLVIDGKDILAGSATGSGKTLAFGCGIIQNAKKGNGIQAMILTPTRELAEQVSEALRKFSKYTHLKIIPVYGGVSIGAQIDKLRTTDIVVGTPGRMLDHISRNTINLKGVKTVVLDEADRMLDMGFIHDVEKILRSCPKKRQTLLFSATISGQIGNLAYKYMNNPVNISVESHVDPTKLTQIYYDVADNLKFSLLVHLLKNEKSLLSMVFCNTQRTTDFVATNLKNNGIKAVAIHGGLTQDKRTKIMRQFNSEKGPEVLTCTDVAARGLDIRDVSHVYNYDSSKESDTYIHRIGRTARAGKDGLAITLLSSKDYENFRRVLSNRALNVEKEDVPQNLERVKVEARAPQRRQSSFRRPSNARGGSGRGGSSNRGGSSGRGPRRR
ncbi:DEAD/DEAH box helicase [archaeon]|nr:DEAD/DEAH box helicase [archaeon]